MSALGALPNLIPVIWTEDVNFGYLEKHSNGDFADMYRFLKGLENEFQLHRLSLGWRCLLALLTEGLSAEKNEDWPKILDEAMALRLVPRFNDPMLTKGDLLEDLVTFLQKKENAFEVTLGCLGRMRPQRIQKP